MSWDIFNRKDPEKAWSKIRGEIEKKLRELVPEGLPRSVEEKVYARSRVYFLELREKSKPPRIILRPMVLTKAILELQDALVEYARSPEGAGVKRLLDKQGFRLPG